MSQANGESTTTTQSGSSGREIPTSIENDISDVSCAANTLYHLLEGTIGNSGVQRVSEEDANSLFWCAGMVVKAARRVSEKYHGEDKEAAHD